MLQSKEGGHDMHNNFVLWLRLLRWRGICMAWSLGNSSLNDTTSTTSRFCYRMNSGMNYIKKLLFPNRVAVMCEFFDYVDERGEVLHCLD